MPQFFELYEEVKGNNDQPIDFNKPPVGFYAKFVKNIDDNVNANNDFDIALEFEKMVEGKRPCGNCIIWGCTKKTTRKCSCGCLQFVCRGCSICLVQM
jgi:hypothetical protein